ncbi:hypothetical protein GGS23DRAFT_550751 [Durotheca rogersii]|uniref:uncharacterized protein n=1 Tax=Durotheca rogersii TaxID=419775 RepID=UPI00221F592F|nr:uncharacterized protein GGS23DRAFT_550751 [Durotheca rogersii]KAI5866450.1 hypothetical protein GGS23DRAFT_550751 [Durotheca rogersii]
MFRNVVVVVALSALSLVSAQANSNSTFKIDPTTVVVADRVSWCQAQQDNCNTLCGTAVDNTCDVDSLDFACVCQGNNAPDLNLYLNTMPWFVCQRLQSNCITQNENNAAGQRNCTATFGDRCGTEDVTDHAGEGSVSQTTSSSASPSATGAATSSSVPTSTSQGAGVPTGVVYLGNGAAAVAVGLFAYML